MDHQGLQKDLTGIDQENALTQAVRFGEVVYVSGQIADPSLSVEEQVRSVLESIHHFCIAAGGTSANLVKINVYVLNFDSLDYINHHMKVIFSAPYPARTIIEVKRLPKDAAIMIDAVVHIG